MVVERIKLQQVVVEEIIDVPGNKFMFVVKFIKYDGSEVIDVILTDTLNGYIDTHDYRDYQIIKIFCCVLNSELTEWDFKPNYDGKRFN